MGKVVQVFGTLLCIAGSWLFVAQGILKAGASSPWREIVWGLIGVVLLAMLGLIFREKRIRRDAAVSNRKSNRHGHKKRTRRF